MDEQHEFTPVPKHSRWKNFLMKVGGADPDTLRRCPPIETDNIMHPTILMIFVWAWQSAIYGTVTNNLFGKPGELDPELLLWGLFIGTLILLYDGYAVMRAGWYAGGLRDLKMAGCDLTGGATERAKAGAFLAIRILLAVGISQLFGIVLSLMIFSHDIRVPIDTEWLRVNAPLITAASLPVDAEIKRETDAVAVQTKVDDGLRVQVGTLQQGEIDPLAADPQMQQAQAELDSLLNQKIEADKAVSAAEKTASDELAGIASQGTSGKPGTGPRRRAALEQLANARGHQKSVGDAIPAVRKRIDALRQQLAANGVTAKADAHQQLPDFQQSLSDGEAKLTQLKAELAASVMGRDAAIKTAVEAAPDYVPPHDGLLDQIGVLEKITDGDPKIYAMVLLIGLVCFGLELAAVLAKLTVTIPSSYGALLVSEAYNRIKRIAESIAANEKPTKKPDPKQSSGSQFSLYDLFGVHPVADDSANDNVEPPKAINDNHEPPKRGRGRPKGSRTKRANGKAGRDTEGEGPKPV